jgi:riboflavin synthase
MFTGIVEEVGTLRARRARGPGARLTIACGFRPLVMGESISVAGVCLTVDAILDDGFEADASAETLERSTLGALPPSSPVNLERALLPTSRLGGHLVGGHVDATARLVSRAPLGDAMQLRFELPQAMARFVAPKGSIAIDGVSLTVNGVDGSSFDVAIIPHTLRATTLTALAPGARVNLEADVLARYVARQLDLGKGRGSSTEGAEDSNDGSLLAALGRAGYL